MRYDDLRSQYAQFSIDKFSAPADNIHMVFWERISLTPKSHKHIPTVLTVPVDLPHKQPASPNMTRTGKHKNSLLTANTSSNGSTAAASVSPKGTRLNNQSISGENGLGAWTGSVGTAISSPIVTPSLSVVSSPKAESRKPVALLSSKIGAKPTLTLGLTYGTPGSGNVNKQGSYQDIMSAIGAMTPSTNTSTKKPTSSGTPSSHQKQTMSSSKSYLELVRPLLQKNKEQKGKLLSGYVPKSQRTSPEKGSRSKRKRVMFAGVSTATPVPAKTARTLVNERTAPPTAPTCLPAPKSMKTNSKVSTLVGGFVPYVPKTLESAGENEVSMDNMPSLDDMFLNGH